MRRAARIDPIQPEIVAALRAIGSGAYVPRGIGLQAGSMNIVLPWPPTVNTYWRSVNGRVLISADGRRYRQAIADQAVLERWSTVGSDRVRVVIEAWAPDKRRRDLDNVLKSLLDALTFAGVWEDDSQVDDLRIFRAPLVGGMVKVNVEAL